MNLSLRLRNYLSSLIVFWSLFSCLTLSAQPSGNHGPKDTDYSIPGGAYFASPNGTGSAPCSEGNPCSLSTAIRKAPRGATVVLKGGTYRTSKYNTNIPRRLTLQPYPGATATLKGSEVEKGWIASGNAWKTSWSDLHGKPNNDNGRATDDNPMADHRDMVYINGQSQKQVSSRSAVGPGKFYVDYSSKIIYIGSNPKDKQVEISAGWWGLSTYDVSESGITIRGLKLMHYGDAGIFIGSPGAVVENNEVVWNGGAGIRVQNAKEAVLKNNLFAYNACQGGGLMYAHHAKLINNSFLKNNYENYNRNSWSASGVKILDSEGIEVRNNSFVDNDANGLWLDGRSDNSILANNFIKNSSRNGIHCEISNDVIIAGNVVVESGKDDRLQGKGISIANSSGVKIYNNSLYNNEIALDIVENDRTDNDPRDPHITRNTVVKNNILSEAFISEYPSALYHMKKKDCDDKAIAAQDHNAYYRSKTGDPDLAVRWKISGNCNDEERLETIQEFRSKLGYEKHGFGIQGGSEPFFVNVGSDNFRLKSTSLAIKAGSPLPSDIARALGWESGKVVDIGAYQTNVSQAPAPAPNINTGVIESISLVRESNQQKISGYTDITEGETINKSDLPSTDLNINANVSGKVGSIVFDYNGDTNYQTESTAPYSLQGNGSSYRSLSLKTGSNSITIKAYSENGGKGTLLAKKTINFYVKDDGSSSSSPSPTPSGGGGVIESISLVRESNQQKISGYTDITEGETINKSDLPSTDLNINANVSGEVGSIVFDYNGDTNYQTESTAPYSLQANGRNYRSLSLKTGSNTITIKAYSESGGKGSLLDKKTINFYVSTSASSSASSNASLENMLEVGVSPNPFVNDINIEINGAATDEVNLQITDYVGNEVYRRNQVNIAEKINLNLSHLPSNIYLLRIVDAAGNMQSVRLQKN